MRGNRRCGWWSDASARMEVLPTISPHHFKMNHNFIVETIVSDLAEQVFYAGTISCRIQNIFRFAPWKNLIHRLARQSINSGLL